MTRKNLSISPFIIPIKSVYKHKIIAIAKNYDDVCHVEFANLPVQQTLLTISVSEDDVAVALLHETGFVGCLLTHHGFFVGDGVGMIGVAVDNTAS